MADVILVTVFVIITSVALWVNQGKIQWWVNKVQHRTPQISNVRYGRMK